MLLTKTVKVKWHYKNKEWYISKGYNFTKMKDEFEVKVNDLMQGCNILVSVKCDCKDCKNPFLKPTTWQNYLKCIHKNGKYYCQKCAEKLYGGINSRKVRLKNSKSFEQWCHTNLSKEKIKQVLSRWDYELNKCSPKEISYSSQGFNNKGYWFKCPKGIHSSELKNIKTFTNNFKKNGFSNVLDCNMCNSFAQWGYDNISNDFLNLYWDWDKNDELGINPWKISKNSNKKVWIFCQEKSYHESYKIRCDSFSTQGSRCPYCGNFHGKVHRFDSLGWLYPQVIPIWSEKNKKSPYDYSTNSGQYVWWKCSNDKHKDYKRKISSSNFCKFRCPECQFSKGEKRIEEWLNINNFIKGEDYIPQKEFDGLTGLGNSNLSYDFYLPNYNLLIEYQGEQHEKPIDFFGGEKQFKKQQEHDRRKKEYANNNKIKLLPIWYWNYENIESILNKKLIK